MAMKSTDYNERIERAEAQLKKWKAEKEACHERGQGGATRSRGQAGRRTSTEGLPVRGYRELDEVPHHYRRRSETDAVGMVSARDATPVTICNRHQRAASLIESWSRAQHLALKRA